MTKADLIKEIAGKTGVDANAVSTIVEAMMTSIKENMAQGEEVFLRGFGSFTLKKRAEKTARNITKNTTVIVPAHNIPFFKPAPNLKNAVAETKVK